MKTDLKYILCSIYSIEEVALLEMTQNAGLIKGHHSKKTRVSQMTGMRIRRPYRVLLPHRQEKIPKIL